MRAPVIVLLLLTSCMTRNAPISDLTTAVRNGDAAQVRALAAKGADVNAPSGNNDWTPLLHAVHTHQNASIAALLDAGADANRGSGSEGLTPLMMAAAYGYDDTVKLLLQRGAKATDGAFDAALTGTPDVDRFTFFSCQDSTPRLIRSAAPHATASAAARRWAGMKRCAVKS